MATMPKYKPGPGWSKDKKTGAWLPHYFLTQDFVGAGVVSLVFKVLAVLILIGGVVSAIVTTNTLHQNEVNHQDTFAIVLGIVAGAVVSASAMAFFGYVLDLLRAIHYGTGYDNAAKTAFNEPSAAGRANNPAGIQALGMRERSAGGTANDGPIKP